MKKYSFILILVLFLTKVSVIAYAATPTPTDKTEKATEAAEIKTIEKIKEMVADKVSKLKLVEKRGLIGKVSDISNTQIIIEDIQGTKRFIDIDELTKFQESVGSSKTFGISDIKKGNTLAFIGLYNKDTERLLARFITKSAAIPQFVEGKITSINDDDYQFVVTTNSGEKKTIDVLKSTTTKSFSKDDGEQKSGFSKLQKGEFVIISGFIDDKDKTLFSSSRILHLINGEKSEK